MVANAFVASVTGVDDIIGLGWGYPRLRGGICISIEVDAPMFLVLVDG